MTASELEALASDAAALARAVAFTEQTTGSGLYALARSVALRLEAIASDRKAADKAA